MARQAERRRIRNDGPRGCPDVEQVGVRVECERGGKWYGVVRGRRQRGDELQGGVCRHWCGVADPVRMAMVDMMDDSKLTRTLSSYFPLGRSS